MSGSGGVGFVIDMATLAILAGVVVVIGALAWMFLRR